MNLATRLGKTATFKQSNSPISTQELAAIAPSIFAEAPHESRSERYRQIPTSKVLENLQKEGFEAFFAAQSRSRVPGKSDYTKHMLRLRHASQIDSKAKGGVPEIILINSHDGTSSYQLLAGWLEFVCMNGLVNGTLLEDIRVKHSGNLDQISTKVIEGSYRVLDSFAELTDQREQMQAIDMHPRIQQVFAQTALRLRYQPDEETGNMPVTIRPEQVIQPRRYADNGSSVWNVFNRAQENLVERGGIGYRTSTGRNMTTQAVRSIDKNTKLNQELWAAAQAIAAMQAEGAEGFMEAMRNVA